jgi:Bacteriocin-protection, YdeI or OmpD-Associated
VPGGVLHKLPPDLHSALIANVAALDAWKDITPLTRNEFICWVEDAKPRETLTTSSDQPAPQQNLLIGAFDNATTADEGSAARRESGALGSPPMPQLVTS